MASTQIKWAEYKPLMPEPLTVAWRLSQFGNGVADSLPLVSGNLEVYLGWQWLRIRRSRPSGVRIRSNGEGKRRTPGSHCGDQAFEGRVSGSASLILRRDQADEVGHFM
jgi:hypothetical protein